MAKYSFNKEEFEAWKRAQQESADLQQKLNTSMKDYLATVKQIGELQKNIKYIEGQISKLKSEQAKAEKDLLDNTTKLSKAIAKGDKDEIDALRKKEVELKKILAAKQKNVDLTEHELGILKKQTTELTEQVKQTNKLSLGFNTITNSLGAVPGLISKGFGMLKGTGIFEMDKEIRNAVRSMAGGQKQYNNMLSTIQKAADTTTMWGVGVKDLAIMQQGYSEAIGKSVMLTEEGYKSMAKLAEDTGLGKEFAVQIAGEMDKFNISAERTSGIVKDTMNIAAKMGVNGAAALKSLQNNLKLAQRFNFKGGIAGLAKLSVEATRLRLDMEGIAGMAEKVFRPEGAIEMAAELATMGGKFAELGDPMQLMFQARNDPEKFAKNIGKASAEFGEFNEKTGEFELKGGLALDRMREISRITGISVEKLQEMAEAQAKIEKIGKGVKPGIFNEEDMSLISSFAKFKDGKWKIEAGQFSKSLSELNKQDIKRIEAEKEELNKRAKEARTFDETVQDLILTFKQQLLPFAQQLKDGLGGPIQDMVKQWSENGYFKTLKEFVSKAGELSVWLGKWVIKAAEWLGPTGTLAVLLGGKFLFESTKWFLNGMALGSGFNKVASVGGGGSILDMLGGKGGKGGPGFMKNYKGLRAMGDSRLGAAKSAFKWSGGLKGMAGRGLGFLGSAGGAGLLSAISSGYNEWSENSAMGIGTGENIGRTVSKGGGAGAGALAGASALAWGGPLGMLIGAIGGGFLGSELGESIGDAIWGDEERNKKVQTRFADYRVNDGIMFHPNDKFMKVNDAITVAGTSTSGNNKLAQELSGSNMSGEISHNFKDLNIRITVDAPSDSEFWRTVVNQPDVMRRITEAVHISTEEAASGKIAGKSKRKFRS